LEDHEVLKVAWEAEKAKIEKENAEPLRGVFMCHWKELLPAMVGKHNWGQNIRKWNTITDSHFPGELTKKYITTSDKALVVTCTKTVPWFTLHCQMSESRGKG
jgi:hypothetical protein